MVSSTRSAERNKDKVVGDSSKKKVVNRKPQSNLSPEKADVLGLRRSAREANSSRLKTPSPQSTRKSERIEKQAPVPPSAPTMTVVKSKKHDPRSPLRMLDRGKTETTSSSAGSKRSRKLHSPLNVKKKESSLKRLNVESGKDEPDTDSVGTKRKKMDARSYKALFKPPTIRSSPPDVAEELLGQDKQPQVNSRGISSKPMGKSNDCNKRIIEKLADESASRTSALDISEKESEGKLVKSSSVHSGNEDPPQPSAGDGSRNLTNASTNIDLLDDSERAPKNCSSFKDGSENDVQCIQPKVTRHVDSDLDLSSLHATSAMDISEKESEGKLLKSSSVHSGNEDPLQPSGGDGLRNLMIGSTIIDLPDDDDSERAPNNCSSFKNAEFKDGSENDVQCIHPKGSVPLSSSGSDIRDLLDNGIKCLKRKSIPELSKFVEYWVPVPLSNCQLEQYCATLLSNSIPLCSCSKSDPIGALRDILFTVRKCCDHPYLVNPSIQESLIAKGCLAQLLDFGIKVCGKLQLLDMILSELKNQGQQVLILYQTIVGGGTSIGDILDDFLRQKFGTNSYERIDSRVATAKKQAAVNRFNGKEAGQFVFLLENRACYSRIKLSSVNIVVIYDSEWNPANDLRALQKICFDSKLEPIKVFRLYSSCTVEEKALLLAKQIINLDNNLQNLSRTTSDTLLVWGASYLFSKLDDYHADSNPASASNISSEQLLLHDTTKELLSLLSGSCGNNDTGCIISKAQLGVGHYSINLPLLGEGKFQVKDGEEAHVFWRKLLEGRNPQWKYSHGSTPRNRKKVKYFDGDTENVEVGKKRRKVGSESVDLASVQVEPKRNQITAAASSKGGDAGPSTAITNQSQSLEKSTCLWTDNVNPESNFISGQRSSNPGVDVDKPQEIIALSNEQKSLHIILKGEMARLCQILEVSEDVVHMVERFLEYVIKNHHVSNESPTIIQAFQMSLFWIAASLLKQKIDKKDSLMMAKKSLSYGCTEEQANHVYSKMRLLKKMFLQCAENTKESRTDCSDAGISQNLESGAERPANKEPFTDMMVAECETEDKLKKIQKKCDKRMKKLIQKQQEELQKFHRTWDEERDQLEKEHKLESACIRSIHGHGSVTIDKLKLLDSEFANKMEEHKQLKEMHMKELEENQLAAKNAERGKAARWLAKAKACHNELKSVDEPLGSQSDDKVGCSDARAHITLSGHENAVPLIEQHTECTNLKEGLCGAQRNDVLSNTHVIAQAEAVGCAVPTETANNLLCITPEREVESSSERTSIAHLPSVLIHSSDTAGATDPTNLPGSSQLIPNEIPMVQASEEVPSEVPEAVPEGVDHAESLEQSDVSKKKCNKGDGTDSNMSDDVNQRNGNESANGCLDSPEQTLLPQAEAVAPDHFGSLTPSQVQLEGSVSGEFQSGGAPVPQDKSTSQGEVAMSQHIHSETPVEPAPSNDLLSVNQSTSQVEVAISQHIHSETPVETPVEPAPSNGRLSVSQSSSQEEVAISQHIHSEIPVEPAPSNDRVSVNQSTSEVEVAISRHIHSETRVETPVEPAPSNDRLPVNQSSSQVEVTTSEGRESDPSAPSNHATAIDNRELQQPVAIDASLHCDQTPGSEVERGINDSERILVPETSCQLSGEQEAPPHQVTSQSRQAQLPNQLNLQSEVDLSHISGSQNLTSQPLYQVPTWYPAPSSNAEPLQNELLRVSKEAEKELKVHEDLKKSLQSECEKEIQESISQISDKYDAKLHDAETAFQLKQNELDKYHNKVLMNRILAEAFRSKCMPSGPPGLRQAMSPIFMQLPVPHQTGVTGHQAASSVGQPQTSVPTVQSSQQLPLSHSTIPPSIFISSSTCQPRATTPTVQATHQPSLPHSVGPTTAYVSPSGSQPAANQHNPTSTVQTVHQTSQTVHQTSALFSGVPCRPPLISTITPSTGNLHIGEVRSPAPHLRPFRPSSSASAPPHVVPSQQPTPYCPATSPSLSQHTPQRIPHSQVPSMIPISSNTAKLESRLPGPHNLSQSAVQLLMDMDQRPRLHNPFASLPDLGATFGSLEQSDFETLGNVVQSGLPSSAATTDVVYLSDDD